MAIRLYKEGQGIWARGTLAALIGGTGLLAALRSFEFMTEEGWFEGIALPGWQIELRSILAVVILLPFFTLGYWAYNHPRLSDFLIDTEAELKNKVTWPNRREATNNSVVVVVTCFLLGIWIVFADLVLRQIKDFIYGTF